MCIRDRWDTDNEVKYCLPHYWVLDSLWLEELCLSVCLFITVIKVVSSDCICQLFCLHGTARRSVPSSTLLSHYYIAFLSHLSKFIFLYCLPGPHLKIRRRHVLIRIRLLNHFLFSTEFLHWDVLQVYSEATLWIYDSHPIGPSIFPNSTYVCARSALVTSHSTHCVWMFGVFSRIPMKMSAFHSTYSVTGKAKVLYKRTCVSSLASFINAFASTPHTDRYLLILFTRSLSNSYMTSQPRY